MRDVKIVINVERGLAGQDIEEELTVSVEDDASPADIEAACNEEAQTYFFNICNYGWSFAGDPA